MWAAVDEQLLIQLQNHLNEADRHSNRQTMLVNDRGTCNIQKQQTEQTGAFSREKNREINAHPLPPPPKLDELCLFTEQENKCVAERPELGPLI